MLHNSASLPDWTSSAKADELRKQFGVDGDTKVLVAIGRLSYEKGHADLVRALDQLRRDKPDLRWKLVLVGSGPEQSNIEAAVRQFGLEDQVIFASQQSDVQPFFQIADLMVLPSHSEGSPHVVLEAMAAGVPIVATRVGGIPEILENGKTAVLVPARDPGALRSAIAELLESSEAATALAGNAKSVLQERFSHEAYKTALLNIYSEVLPL